MQISVKKLNDILICRLCDGYYRNAHTIPECMHTFCKVCVYKHFQNECTKKTIKCPTCSSLLGSYSKSNILAKVVFDRNLQGVVDKIVLSITNNQANSAVEEAAEAEPDRNILLSLTFIPGDVSPAFRLPLMQKKSLKLDHEVQTCRLQKFIHRRMPRTIQQEISPKNIQITLYDSVLEPDQTVTKAVADLAGSRKAIQLFYCSDIALKLYE